MDFELNLDLAFDTAAPGYLNQVVILTFSLISEQWNYMQGINGIGTWRTASDLRVEPKHAQQLRLQTRGQRRRFCPGRWITSEEIENKFRAERYRILPSGLKVSGGMNAEYTKTASARKHNERGLCPRCRQCGCVLCSDFKLAKYGAFAQLPAAAARQQTHFVCRASLTVRSPARRRRVDVAGMSLANPLDQFSPRLSASWSFAPGWTWNAGMPASTTNCLPTPSSDMLGLVPTAPPPC